ncbi:MAG: hypothetical protein WCD75_05090 [Rhodoplanes sp.]
MAREHLDDYQQGARLITCERGNRPKGNKHILIFAHGIRLEGFRRRKHVISGTRGVRFLIKRDSCFPLGGGALDAYERTTRKLLVSIISWPFDDLTQVKPAQTGSPHA